MRKLFPLLLAGTVILGAAPDAAACACCADPGQRTLSTETFADYFADEVRLLAFDGTAWPYLGGDPDDPVRGIRVLSEAYETVATWTDDGLTLDLTGMSPDRSGTLVLTAPRTITVFSVDPTPGSQDGMVQLYKEWRMEMPAAGTGAFDAVAAGQHTATLILHGRGNSCDMAGGMTNWTLDVKGPGADFRLFGKLVAP